MRRLYIERKNRLKTLTGGSLFRKDVTKPGLFNFNIYYELLSFIHNTYPKYLEEGGCSCHLLVALLIVLTSGLIATHNCYLNLCPQKHTN